MRTTRPWELLLGAAAVGYVASAVAGGEDGGGDRR